MTLSIVDAMGKISPSLDEAAECRYNQHPFPYHIYGLDQFSCNLDIPMTAILLTTIGNSVKHRTPFTAMTNRTVCGFNKRPF
jgi:hypothetical protein